MAETTKNAISVTEIRISQNKNVPPGRLLLPRILPMGLQIPERRAAQLDDLRALMQGLALSPAG